MALDGRGVTPAQTRALKFIAEYQFTYDRNTGGAKAPNGVQIPRRTLVSLLDRHLAHWDMWQVLRVGGPDKTEANQ